MKARSAFVLAALFILAGCLGIAVFLFARSSPAGNIDKAKLRELAYVPCTSAESFFDYSILSGYSDEKTDHLAEIAQLRKQLKGDSRDVECYLRLGGHFGKLNREEDAKKAFGKAVSICRQQVREHPQDARWLAELGDALRYNGEANEGEKLLHRVLEQAPNEWRGWLGMADCLDSRSFQALFGDTSCSVAFRDTAFLIPGLSERMPTKKQIEEFRRLWKQARPFYDRAVELAPREEEKPHRRRLASTFIHAVVEAGLSAMKGERRNGLTAVYVPEGVPDARWIALLWPGDPQSIRLGMSWEVSACAYHLGLEMREKPSSWASYLAFRNGTLVDVLPADSRTFVRWCMDRLERLTKDPDKATAAAASEILGEELLKIKTVGDSMRTFMPSSSKHRETREKILENLRRAVRLDPSRERAWDLLLSTLLEEGKIEEAAAAGCQRIAVQDNAPNRALLAKVYARGDRLDKAAEELRAGLKSDPKDLNCLLREVALALKHPDARSLREAGEHLAAIEPRVKEEKNKQHEPDYLLLKGIHLALTDRPHRAKDAFRQVLKRMRGEPTTTRALVALGGPLRAGDQQLAIDYVRGKGGSVERKDLGVDSPVVSVHLGCCQVTDEHLFVLSAFPQLRELDLGFTAITDAGLNQLTGLTDLERLFVVETKITDKGLSCLKAFRGLRHLSLESTEITDAGLSYLKALPNLQTLHLAGFSETNDNATITDAGLVHLRNLSKLQSVTLGPSITDKGLAYLAAIPHLRHLMLLGSQITDEGMRRIGLLGELQELWLSSTKITDAGLIHLKGLHNLKRLHLGGTRITDAGLAHLKALSQLEELELDGTAISDAGLVHLSGLTNLRKLNLSDSGRKIADSTAATKPLLTGAGLKHLNGLTELKHLELAGRPITDAGLNYVENFTKMEYLSLSMTNITDAGLERLHSLKQMSLMNVRDTKSTLQGVAELRKSLPKLEVYR